jgi:hypothetical protein
MGEIEWFNVGSQGPWIEREGCALLHRLDERRNVGAFEKDPCFLIDYRFLRASLIEGENGFSMRHRFKGGDPEVFYLWMKKTKGLLIQGVFCGLVDVP